ncbi:hypothetical protein NSP_43080 [Nodularia spumigena CCY9414]|jgi:hypothetical protein|nr:hypothetical protein NSP_43080 [Nodularia spumigena CCY9414]
MQSLYRVLIGVVCSIYLKIAVIGFLVTPCTPKKVLFPDPVVWVLGVYLIAVYGYV